MPRLRANNLFTAFFVCISYFSICSAEAKIHPNHSTILHSKSKSFTAATLRKRQPQNTSAATWQMPWQIRPIGYGLRGPGARRERIVQAFVRKIGRVRGTRTAIATIGQPLRPARGPNRAVEACRAAVSREATKLGAREVEAVSAGRERITAARNAVAPVRFRITYKMRKIYEVRLSVLTCLVNRKGNLIDAFSSP